MADGKENSFQPHAANFVTGIRGASYLVDQCNYQYTFNKDGVDLVNQSLKASPLKSITEK